MRLIREGKHTSNKPSHQANYETLEAGFEHDYSYVTKNSSQEEEMLADSRISYIAISLSFYGYIKFVTSVCLKATRLLVQLIYRQ